MTYPDFRLCRDELRLTADVTVNLHNGSLLSLEKFGTYTRDPATGLDYADQRYYGSGVGRFMTADPYRAS